MIGEARGESPEGRLAVASVIRNRARQRGLSPSQVVLEPNQFEPWGNPATRQSLLSIKPTDPLYQEVARQIASDQDPTGGASHFYAPKAQAQLGREKPSWDNGSGRAIGNHLFFNLDGSPASDGQGDVNLIGQVQGDDPYAQFSDAEVVDAFPTDQAAPTNAPGSSEANPIDLADPVAARSVKRGAYIVVTDPEDGMRYVTRAASDAKEGVGDYAVGDGVYVRELGLDDRVGAAASAWSEQIPFLDESVAFTTGLATGEGYEAMRDRQSDLRDVDNNTDGQRSARVAGGLAGFGTSLLAPGGSWVSGARGATAVGRAGLLGGGYGALYGAGNTDGGAKDRLAGAATGAGLGAVTGGFLQAGGNAMAGSAARARANPTPQRRLAEQGVLLTPGQMIGGAAQTVEDAIGGTLPIFGDAINTARRRGLESFDNTATNTSLRPIGVELTDTAGRQGVRTADDAISQAYREAGQGVSVAEDQPFNAAIQQARRAQNTTPAMRQQLSAVLDNALERVRGTAISGDEWKQIDSELAAAVRAADKASASAPEQRILRDRLQEGRTAWRDLLERTDPQARAAYDAADEAFAQYRLVRKASSDVASAGRDGNSSPRTLNRAVIQAGGERRAARGESLLQDLTDDAMQVLPSTVPNSGTALRGAVGGGLLTGAIFEPVTAAATGAGLLAGAAVYSRPVQTLINNVYRDSTPGAVRQALADLEQAAARNPALAPTVERLRLMLSPGRNAPETDRPLLRQDRSEPQGQGLLRQ